MPNLKFVVGVDIGGSHIACAIVDFEKRELVEKTKFDQKIASDANIEEIINIWAFSIKKSVELSGKNIDAIGLSIPGPFDYENGISKIYGVGKYESILGVNVRLALTQELKHIIDSPENIQFINDADGFILGESWKHNWDNERVIGVTLGTGYGSGFIKNGEIQSNAEGVPTNGELYCQPYKDGIAEDYVSTRWFVDTWKKRSGKSVSGVKEIADLYEESEEVKNLFDQFGENLFNTLSPWIDSFKPTKLILGGRIVKALDKFKTSFERAANNNLPEYITTSNTEDSAILGACKNIELGLNKDFGQDRNTKQLLLPIEKNDNINGDYNVYPDFALDINVEVGFDSLASEIYNTNSVLIDGFIGVQWDKFITNLSSSLEKIGDRKLVFINTDAALKSEKEIDKMIAPFLGGDDPIFGKLYKGGLIDFYDLVKLNNIPELENDNDTLFIAYGIGASLLNWKKSKLIYVDVPKNEIQFRSRAEKVLNIGASKPISTKPQYKRMYFVDWVVLNQHKENLLPTIDYIIDEQRLETITWLQGDNFRSGLEGMSKNAFRVRPWFEPGAWGGQWIKDKVKGLPQNVPNYAWSFELIVPENGIIFEGNNKLLEVSFDFLMFHNNKNVLGEAANRFGNEFPIRFDFLDTIEGGNLSVQCHPRVDYMKKHFGHNFTQDETYYMLDAAPESKVYLGFNEGVTKEKFANALNASHNNAEAMDIEEFVQVHDAKKHDLFLIPNGTIHASGTGGMVLEISSTPYIFTFKMYDWMSLDLDGNPRPINIERGIDNLYFDRQGKKVKEELISKQIVTEKGDDYEIVNLSTHSEHFYAVDRFEFDSEINVKLNNQCHVLSLVEGEQVTVVTNNKSFTVNYAETFVVPAASDDYKIINKGKSRAKVIKAFVKSEAC